MSEQASQELSTSMEAITPYLSDADDNDVICLMRAIQFIKIAQDLLHGRVTNIQFADFQSLESYETMVEDMEADFGQTMTQEQIVDVLSAQIHELCAKIIQEDDAQPVRNFAARSEEVLSGSSVSV